MVVGEGDIRPSARDAVVGQHLADLVERLCFLRLGSVAHDTPQRRIRPHLRSTLQNPMAPPYPRSPTMLRRGSRRNPICLVDSRGRRGRRLEIV